MREVCTKKLLTFQTFNYKINDLKWKISEHKSAITFSECILRVEKLVIYSSAWYDNMLVNRKTDTTSATIYLWSHFVNVIRYHA